jgi:hypothetical protein
LEVWKLEIEKRSSGPETALRLFPGAQALRVNKIGSDAKSFKNPAPQYDRKTYFGCWFYQAAVYFFDLFMSMNSAWACKYQ